MEQITFKDWVFELNSEKTKRLYNLIKHGSSMDCNCEECQNFRLLKPNIYPEELMKLFLLLHIDRNKEIENYCLDPSLETHISSTWFHFVGRIVKEGSFGNLRLNQCSFDDQIKINENTYLAINSEPNLVIKEMENEPIVQLEIVMRVPWAL